MSTRASNSKNSGNSNSNSTRDSTSHSNSNGNTTIAIQWRNNATKDEHLLVLFIVMVVGANIC